MNNEKIGYTNTDEVKEVIEVKPNRKERRHPKMPRSMMTDCISDEERAFRNRKNKLAKSARKRNR